ncbi:MAG TPA: alpha/beta fold hydrolase [Terriglobales bacterium]|jgi:predicted alpha/beta-hydrolase family hydrolase|nr:alpha/beta fold hydrolase [Terriglobales bacterium]
MSGGFEPFTDSLGTPAVRGFLHRPARSSGDALVLTHGAGSDCSAPLLVALAETLAETGWTVLRCDLPFRQSRPHGPPRGSDAEDRAGLRRAVLVARGLSPGRVFLGGQSYGGRQASMLAAEEPGLADGLLLLSYPLHPPGKPDQLRTRHLPKIQTPALFVSGSQDPFGSPSEMQAALRLIPAEVSFLLIEGAGHDLGFGRRVRAGMQDVPQRIAHAFRQRFVAG